MHSITLIACLNEAGGIVPTIIEMRKYIPKTDFLIIDGKSSDGTKKIAIDQGVLVLDQNSKGKGNAVREALQYIRREPVFRDCKYLVINDADYTYACDKLPKMFSLFESDPSLGMVIGRRIRRYNMWKAYGLLLGIGNMLFALLSLIVNRTYLIDPLSGLRIVRLDVIREWLPTSKYFEVEAELNKYVSMRGYGIREIPVMYRKRIGVKKLRIIHALWILKKLVIMQLSSKRV